MNDRQFEEKLNEEINRLDRDIRPTRDLWPGIDHSINSNTIAVPVPLAIAASVLLVFSIAISGTLYVKGSQQSSANIDAFITLLETEHQRNKQALLVEYQNQPALAPDWEMQMEQLELAEQAIYDALKDDSENMELLKILRQVQGKQIELIESVYAPLFTSI